MQPNRSAKTGQFVSGAVSTVEDRLWPKVDKNGPVPDLYPDLGPCWDWTGSKTNTGYGLLRVDSTAKLAHRITLSIALGRPLLRSEKALHVCDRPSCVRNDTVGFHEVRGVLLPRRGHLFVGDMRLNGRDMSQKGRAALQRHPHLVKRGADFVPPPGWHKSGEDSYSAVLTADKVREIRRLRADGMTLKQIAALFGINFGTVWQIVNRKTWRHIE